MNRISWQQEHEFLTVVITIGPPPPIPTGFTAWHDDDVLGSKGLALRLKWLESTVELCKERFGLTNGSVGEFITAMDTWWEVNQEVRRCTS